MTKLNLEILGEAGDHTQLTWVTGETVFAYTNWLPGQPITDFRRDNCGAISKSANIHLYN